MGVRHNYVCEKCQYSAFVEGGSGMLFSSRTHTIVCHDCKSLSELNIGKISDAMFSDPPIQLDGKVCPNCQSTNIELWGFIHTGINNFLDNHTNFSCPKCGGEMKKGKGQIYVD